MLHNAIRSLLLQPSAFRDFLGIFQRAMSRMLEGLDGVTCHVDDIIIQGATQSEHDTRVRAVHQRLREEGLTLNDKCELSKREIRFLGHIFQNTRRPTQDYGQRPIPNANHGKRATTLHGHGEQAPKVHSASRRRH